MTKKAIKALKQSIAHWRRLATNKIKFEETVGSHECALCLAFNTTEKKAKKARCYGCPVFEYTHEQFCEGTPFEAAAKAFEFWRENNQREGFLKKARAELAFLESLL
jgi:hypothetical protein